MFYLALSASFENIHSKRYIGSLEGTLEYYYHVTPGEPL